MRTNASPLKQLLSTILVGVVAFCQPLTIDTNLRIVWDKAFGTESLQERAASPTVDESATDDSDILNRSIMNDLDPSRQVQLDPDLFPSRVDQEILSLFYKGMKHAHQIYNDELLRLGDEKAALASFVRAVDSDLVVFRNHTGDVEITNVDKLLTVRVVHKETNQNVVFVGSDLSSDHMQMLMARLSLKRTTKFHQIDQFTINKTIHKDKPETTKDWLSTYWKAIHVKPDAKQTRFAFLTGSVQTILTIGMGTIFYYTGFTDSLVEPKVFLMSGLSFVLGTSMAIYGKTLKNWQIAFSTPFTRYLKQTGIGLFCKYLYYSLKYVVIDGKGLVQSFVTDQPWLGKEALTHNVHSHILTNTAFSNINRTAWYSFPALWESLGKGREMVKFKVLGKEVDLGVNYNQLYFQSIYLVPFLMSKMDLIFQENVTLPFSIPGLGPEVPVGRLILLTGMVVAIGLNDMLLEGIKQYAVKKARYSQSAKDIEFETKVKSFIQARNAKRKGAFIKLFTSFTSAARCAGSFLARPFWPQK